MSVIKNSDIDIFLSKPNPLAKVILFCGPNYGLSYERAKLLALKFISLSKNDSSITKIEEDIVFEDPEYLTNITSSGDFFNEISVIFIKIVSRNLLLAIKKYLSTSSPDIPVIIIAGDIARSHTLRSFMETNNSSAVIVSYPDEKYEIANILKHSFDVNSLKLAPEIINFILDNISNDRLILRSEINKIVTYCGSDEEVSLLEIQELIGDTSSFVMQNLIDNAFIGNKKEVEQIYNRLQESKDDQSILCSMVLNHLVQIINILKIATTESQITNIITQSKTIHFSRKNLISLQLKKWNTKKIIILLNYTHKQLAEIRKNVNFKNIISNRLLIKICSLASEDRR